MRRLTLILLLLGLMGLPNAWGDVIDPASLHIGPGAGTVCAVGCAFAPNLIGTAGVVDVYQTQNTANKTIVPPELLILGVPNTAGAMASNPISSVTYFNPYPGSFPSGGVAGSSAFAPVGQYGLAAVGPATGAGGYFGSFTSSFAGTPNDVYKFLSLFGNANGSENWTNWSGADSAINGITATSFGIYVFALTGQNLGPNGLIDIHFGSGPLLSPGTFVIAYGQESGCISNGCVYSTPFTEAGLSAGKVSAPEEGTFTLLGTALLVLMGALGRRTRIRV